MINNDDIIGKMTEEELIKTIDNFLIFCGENIEGISIKDKRKLLKKMIYTLEDDIYVSEYQLEQTRDKEKIQELNNRIDADKQVSREIKTYINCLPSTKIRIFKKK